MAKPSKHNIKKKKKKEKKKKRKRNIYRFDGEQLKETLAHRHPCYPQSPLGDNLEPDTPSPLHHHHPRLPPPTRLHHSPSQSHQKSL